MAIELKAANTVRPKPQQIANPAAPLSGQPASIPTVPAVTSLVQSALISPSSATNALPDDPASVRRQIHAMHDQIANAVATGKVSERLKFATPDYSEVDSQHMIATRQELEAAGDQVTSDQLTGEHLDSTATAHIDTFEMRLGKADITVTFNIKEDDVNATNQVVSSQQRVLQMRHHWIKYGGPTCQDSFGSYFKECSLSS